jgi:thiol:disulfide interchange protein DsbD
MKMYLILIGFLLALSISNAEQKYIQLDAKPNKLELKKGDEFKIQLSIKLAKSWYTYSIKEQIGPDGIGPSTTEIKIKDNEYFSQIGLPLAPKPKVKYDSSFKMKVEHYKESVSFILNAKAKKDFSFATAKTFVNVYIQYCDTTRCLGPEEIDVAIQNAIAKNLAEIEIDTTQVAKITAAPNANNSDSKSSNPTINTNEVKTDSQKEYEEAINKGVGSFIWLAIGFGIISIFMPCVYPMIPITVSFFTKRSEKATSSGLRDSFIFALGIISTFVFLGIISAFFFGSTDSLTNFAANGWFNLVLAIVIFILALNLFGAFEIQVPTSLTNKLNAKSQGGGLLGIFLMGLTFSLTSFTCTVPFVSTTIGSASSGNFFYPILGMLVYSSVFAAPFFLLSLFPRVMKSLPKSGGWMNSIKVVFGFLEVAFAIKFLSQADVAWGLEILPREVFIASWVACSCLITLYILGFFRMKLDSAIEKLSGLRVMLAIFFALITIYLFYGISGNMYFQLLNSYLPPYSFNSVASINKQIENEDIKWIEDYQTGINKAKLENKNVFIDFTGWTCTNCRWMEMNIFPQTDVKELMSKYVLIRLYTDRRNDPTNVKNKNLQQSRYRSIELPLYVILKPNEDLIATSSYSSDKNQFVSFLKKGL